LRLREGIYTEEIVFVRKATGLVKSIGPFSILAMSFIYVTEGIYYALPISFGQFPGTNTLLTYGLGTFLEAWSVLAAVWLTVAMPRTSADYVAISRILSPPLGFLASMLLWQAVMFWVGGATSYVSTMLGDILIGVGTATKAEALVNLGSALVNDIVVVVACGILIIITYFILNLVGTKYVSLVANIMFAWIVIGSAIGIGAFAYWNFASPGFAPNAWDHVWGAGAWNEVETVAKSNGWADFVTGAAGDVSNWGWPGGWTMAASMAAMPTALESIWGFELGTVVAGEIKEPAKSFTYGTLGSLALCTVYHFIAIIVTTGFYGQWISYFSYNALNGYTDQYQVNAATSAWWSHLLAAPLYGFSTPLGIFVEMIGVVCNYAYGLWAMTWSTRYLFAWSFDRFGPQAFAKVNQRWRTPHYALLFIAIVAAIYIPAMYINPLIAVVNLGAGAFLRYFLICITTMILPFVKPQIFERGIATWTIKGMPVATIIASIGAPFTAFVYISFVARLAGDYLSMAYQAFWLGFPMIIFMAYWAHNKSKGIDVMALYREIPPA